MAKKKIIKQEPSDYEDWQFEYMFFMVPDMDTSVENQQEHFKWMMHYNWTKISAKIFRAGYKAGHQLLLDHIQEIVKNLE